MEKLFLESPNNLREEAALDYLNEHISYKSNLNGTGGMDNILQGKYSYEEWLIEIEKRKDKEYAYSINRVPGETYFLIRETDNKIVGMINIRHDLTPEMLYFGGHIGYGIRPTERQKGYNKINLYLGLLVAKKMGLEKVMIDCDCNNIGSDKTIQALGGVLERCELDPSDNTMTNVYWIDVDDSIEKYYELYKDTIILDNNFKNSINNNR